MGRGATPGDNAQSKVCLHRTPDGVLRVLLKSGTDSASGIQRNDATQFKAKDD